MAPPKDQPDEAQAQPDPRHLLGDRGEELAAYYLEENGWEVIERNYTFSIGEIDLIARRFDKHGCRTEETRAIVEVKTRRTSSGPPPEDAVNRTKRGRLVRLAKLYAQKENLREVNLRFDVIAVDFSAGEPQITHFPCAFDADARIW